MDNDGNGAWNLAGVNHFLYFRLYIFILLIYNISKDFVSDSVCIASNGRVISEK
jgi:hypothetical protein